MIEEEELEDDEEEKKRPATKKKIIRKNPINNKYQINDTKSTFITVVKGGGRKELKKY